MYVVSLKRTGIPESKDSKRMMTYVDLLRLALEHRPEQGFVLSEMRARMRILDKIDALKPDPENATELVLEDADFEKLKYCVAQAKWGFIHRDLVQFGTDVEGSPKRKD